LSSIHVASNVWVNEYITPWDTYGHGITEILAHKKTAFQEMYVVRSGAYGKALVLDGLWQSCEGDEFLYHEPLVHPACVMHGGPQRVLILGGGEGATPREVLKWNTVQQCVMVDIDGEVVAACREHLPEMHQGAFEDPRCELIIGDAIDFLDTTAAGSWDLIISDLSDPIEEGPSFKLFTREYFDTCRRALAPGGKLVVQAGQVAPPLMSAHVRLVKTLEHVFADVASYCSPMASYGSPWGFALASATPLDRGIKAVEVDALLASATDGRFRTFDGTSLVGLLHPPKYLRDAIAAETRIFTLAEPPKFFGKGTPSATATAE
jgi:spermidine synthase